MGIEPRSVCVFCGSSTKVAAGYLDLARAVGRRLAEAQIELVYGGASVGLMGAVADAALGAGGRVVGVLPASLRSRELAHLKLTELHFVDTMAARKELMFRRSGAFLTLPGGFGTLDELFEAVTLRQVGEHTKRCAVLDHEGFFGPLLSWCDRAVAEGFVPDNVRDAIERLEDLSALDPWLASLTAP